MSFVEQTIPDNKEGYIEIILGNMYAGKTSRIIQIYNIYSYIGKSIAVINYSEDTRYHDTMLSTHDHKMIPCIMSMDLNDLWNNEKNMFNAHIRNADVILINEGQFFKNLASVVLDMAENEKKIVYICGLDGDFKRQRFGELLDLIPFCDKVEKLSSLCSTCKNGKKAIFSHRVTEESSQIVIGSDNYKPLCRSCYLYATGKIV